jgi:hypothetical protein
MEVNSISDYLKPNMPLPQYLPYPRFLLDTDLSHTAKLLYTLLDWATRKWGCLLNNFHRTKTIPPLRNALRPHSMNGAHSQPF